MGRASTGWRLLGEISCDVLGLGKMKEERTSAPWWHILFSSFTTSRCLFPANSLWLYLHCCMTGWWANWGRVVPTAGSAGTRDPTREGGSQSSWLPVPACSAQSYSHGPAASGSWSMCCTIGTVLDLVWLFWTQCDCFTDSNLIQNTQQHVYSLRHICVP